MKTRMLMFWGMMLCVAVGLQAHSNGADWPHIYFIESGSKWEIEVQSNIDPSQPAFQVTEWLEGPVEIDGKLYLELWVQIGEEAPKMMNYLWLSNSNSRIYAIDPNDAERRERLIYKFAAGTVDDEPLTILNWDGTLSEEEYSFKTKHGESIENSGFKYMVTVADLYPLGADKTEENCLGSVEWAFGIGGMHGFTNQCYSICGDYTTTLKRMITSCSGTVYDASTAGIDAVNTEEAASSANNIKYRIDGTLFREGDKGIYIMNGKKYIAR